jgi:hypothetical protein
MDLPLSIFRADQEVFNQALNSPETGMGYQQLTIRFAGNLYNDIQAFLVNADYLFQFENFNNLPLFLDLEHLPVMQTLRQVFSLSILTNSRFSVPATDTLPPYTYYSKPGDMFIRLSAFSNDRRVTSDGGVLPGTYATTTTDMSVTPSGLAAVGRYALPNRLSAYHVYRIIPPVDTPVLFGTVMPNYGLCGGGVEVYFPNGCPKGSAVLYDTIPNK